MSDSSTPATFPLQDFTANQGYSIRIDPSHLHNAQNGVPHVSFPGSQVHASEAHTFRSDRREVPLPAGHPALAAHMSKVPEMAMFRRFGTLNLQNILYLQAEMLELEETLQNLQSRESQGNEEQRKYAKNWWYLRHAKKRGGTGEQWSLVKIIRTKLYEYSVLPPFNGWLPEPKSDSLTDQALIQQHYIMQLPKPTTRDTVEVQKLLESEEMGPLALDGDDSQIWGFLDRTKPPFHDLVALLPRHNGDPFSNWVTVNAHKLINTRPFRLTVGGLQGYKDETLMKWTNVFVNVLASLFPVASIVILYQVKHIGARFGVIAGFSVLLSFCLSAFTTAKQSEVFSVAAAFAAVQVVFVSIGNNCDCG